MALRFISGIAPEHNDVKLLVNSSSAPAGVSIDTTTDSGALTPSDGTYFLKLQRNASAPANGHPFVEDLSLTAKAYSWVVARDWIIEGTLVAADAGPVVAWYTGSGTTTTLDYVATASNKYKIRFRITTTTTEFDTNTKYAIRVQLDGTNMTLWVNGVQEAQVAFTDKITNRTLRTGALSLFPTGAVAYLSRVILVDSDSLSDRPGTTVVCRRLNMNADWATENEYADQVDCTGTAGTYTDGTLNGSAQVDETVYWCDIHSAHKQMSEVEDLSFTDPILGMVTRSCSRMNIAGKIGNGFHRISDGTTSLDVQWSNLVATSFEARVCVFDTPPSSTWEAMIESPSGLKMGVRNDSANTANDEHAAFIAEVFAVDNDPPIVVPPEDERPTQSPVRGRVQRLGQSDPLLKLRRDAGILRAIGNVRRAGHRTERLEREEVCV